MLVHVLGVAAGGGLPQWNCNCCNCAAVRAGALNIRPRTQSSIAISDDGERWLLVNASPDVRAQVTAFAPLHPRRGLRDTGIAAVLLVDAQVDHVSGLAFLREGGPLDLYCTDAVQEDLRGGFPLIDLLGHYGGVHCHRVPVDGGSFIVPALPGLRFTAIALAGKAPPYSPHRERPQRGDNIALHVRDERNGATVFYAPGLATVDDGVRAQMSACDCLLVDGTFWSEDEMRANGVGERSASSMGHLPQSGPGGMIEVLSGMPAPRKVLVHINNTNPVLVEDGPERARLAAAGIEVGFDGMHLEL